MSRVIDLGELRHGDEPESPPPPARRPPTAAARVVALGIAALLALAGAAPAPSRPSGVALPAPHGAHFLVVDDRLVVAPLADQTGRGGRDVTGYRLPSGAPVWRFTAGDDVTGLSTVAGLLLVMTSATGVEDIVSTALDPGTGQVRWRQPGYPVLTQAGGVILDSVLGGTGTIRKVDPSSGAVRWSLPLIANGIVYGFGDRGVTSAVLLADDGRVEVYDADTGALRRSGRLPPPPNGVPYRMTQVVGDLLLVDDGSGTATAYGLDRLDRRWTLPAAVESAAWFADCGEVICWRNPASHLRTYDPATGRPRWSDDHWLDAARVGDRLLAAASTGEPAVELAVLDPGTGRTLARLGRWRPAGVDRNGARLLGLRAVAGDRTLVAELDVATGQVRYRAVLPGSGGDCVAAAAVVVCLRPTGGLMVWPVDR